MTVQIPKISDIPEAERTPLVLILLEAITQLREEVQLLKDEIAKIDDALVFALSSYYLPSRTFKLLSFRSTTKSYAVYPHHDLVEFKYRLKACF
ncbi:hypothetical protein [Desulfobacterium sp. N47]|uniref:Uncharacterized protein n=1 Tax=uncultured Desulfobacterium sp. TaxID=201089 RepID=E1YLJ1_9BACT|nr:unknown protein [uncultured Desulfobacterium sp.]